MLDLNKEDDVLVVNNKCNKRQTINDIEIKYLEDNIIDIGDLGDIIDRMLNCLRGWVALCSEGGRQMSAIRYKVI